MQTPLSLDLRQRFSLGVATHSLPSYVSHAGLRGTRLWRMGSKRGHLADGMAGTVCCSKRTAAAVVLSLCVTQQVQPVHEDCLALHQVADLDGVQPHDVPAVLVTGLQLLWAYAEGGSSVSSVVRPAGNALLLANVLRSTLVTTCWPIGHKRASHNLFAQQSQILSLPCAPRVYLCLWL
jgi:hypothetical protein